MVVANEAHVFQRLAELLRWAEYIQDSLLADQWYERGTLKVLGALVESERLTRLREDARVLAERLRETLDVLKARAPLGACAGERGPRNISSPRS
jgi:hypothetical protein